MAYNISAFAGAGAQFFDSNGDPLSGGLLYVYTAGTTTPVTTWTSNSGAVANTNPIVLDSAGRTPNEIWLNSGVTYKFVLKTSTGVLIGTYDNIPAIDDPTVFNNLITVTGTNALIGTSVPPYTAYTAGMTLSFIPVNTNTGAVTISVDGLGSKNIYVGASTALGGGELVAGRIAQIEYDGTRFQLYQSTLADGSVTTNKIANNAVTPAKLSTGAPTWDANSHLGVGTTLKTWPASYSALQLGSTSAHLVSSGAGLVIASNYYVDSGGTGRYATTNPVSLYSMSLGFHFWYRAPSGTADSAVSTTTLMSLDAVGQLSTLTTGGGSLMEAYAARAWVNFNGTGAVAIRASANVSSITDNGVGDYTINFTNALPDANYCVQGTSSPNSTTNTRIIGVTETTAPTTTALRIQVQADSGTTQDAIYNNVAIFR